MTLIKMIVGIFFGNYNYKAAVQSGDSVNPAFWIFETHCLGRSTTFPNGICV